MEEFEKWLRRQCFQKPTPEAYDLAKGAWGEASKGEEATTTDTEVYEGDKLPKSPIDTWVSRKVRPPRGRVLIAYCPEWCSSRYQVCEWDGAEFTYDGQPNDRFDESVEKWSILYEEE
jgi:hypothetical protein